MSSLKIEDISENIRGKISVQGYGKNIVIDGVEIIELKKFVGEDGTFEELIRVKDDGTLELFPDFKLRQTSRSQLLPGAIKAWHLHFKQDDIWYVASEDHMILGLWDVRAKSPTKDQKMKITMGGGNSKLVYIPRGVAHGIVNLGNNKGTVLYFVNEQFNPDDPDENRLAWDLAGSDFWTPEIG